jgi:hypothetical protein
MSTNKKPVPSLDTPEGRLVEYDLNIFVLDEVPANVLPIFENSHELPTRNWYLDVYRCEYIDGASTSEHVVGPFMFTDQERQLLKLESAEWEEDSWYGMWGFLQDYKAVIETQLPRLYDLLHSLPRYVDA